MKVSVIIPIFNKEKYLKNSIDSVLSQTYDDFELILIDDGSTDNSNDIASMYSIIDKRVKVYGQKNSGVSFTRNFGISIAQGEYISFLDADDTWDSSFLKDMVESIGDSDVCYSGHYVFNGSERKKARIKFIKGDILLSYIKNITTPNTNSFLLNKEFLHRNSLYFDQDLNLGEDMLFFAKVLANSKEVKTTKKFLSNYNIIVKGSLSKTTEKKTEDDFQWLFRLIEYLEQKNPMEFSDHIENIKYYRLYGSIVYELYKLLKKAEYKKMSEQYKKYKKELDDFKFTNGFRSIKIYLMLRRVRKLIPS